MLKLDSTSMKKIIYFQIVFVMIMELMISMFKFPSSIRYLTDVIMIILFIYIIHGNVYIILKKINLSGILIIILAFFIIGLLGSIYNLISPFLLIWEVRNIFRFFLFFISCVCILDEEYVNRIINLLLKLQYINLILCIIQYFVLGYEQDYLGGIFGTNQGCNSYMNVYLCIIVIISISKYFQKKTSIKSLLFIVLSSMIIAALAELKLFYLEFILIFILSIIFNKPSFKVFTMIIIGISSLFLGLIILKNIFPDQFKYLIDYESAMKYAELSSESYGIDRMNAFNQINDMFFKGDKFLLLIGFGLGSCAMSNFSIFTSEFYRQFGYLNYNWFAHAMIFIQTGYIGTIIFVMFFIKLFVYAVKTKKYIREYKEYTISTMIIIIILIINFIYNNAIRTEVAYLSFFILSIVPILNKSHAIKIKALSN